MDSFERIDGLSVYQTTVLYDFVVGLWKRAHHAFYS
jgi:hypothetical protein